MESQKIPKLEHTITYLNLNKQLLQKQHNKFPVQKLMLMLDHTKLKYLEKQFNNYPTGLELPSFLFIMKQILGDECEGYQKFYLIDGLIKLFHCIDVNGDGHMLWQQFTEYIIEAIHKSEKPISQNQNYLQKQIIESAYSKLGKQYKIQRIIDLNSQNIIKKCFYCVYQSKFLTLQKNSNKICIYDQDFKQIEQIQIRTQKSYYYILDFDFDQDNLLLGIVIPNNTVFCNFKLTKPKHRYIKYFKQSESQSFQRLWYLPKHKYWAFSMTTGQIKIYSARFKNRNSAQFIFIHSIKSHSGLITSIKQIIEPELICTSSLDGTIKLFSTITLRSLEFDDISDHKFSAIDSKCKKGYQGIDASAEFGNYILVYGFSSDIYIYCLDISLTKGYNNKYSEHMSPIISAKFIKGYPYILSVDQRSGIRIWNYKTYKTNQVINGQKLFSNSNTLLVVPQLNSFYIFDRKVAEFKSLSFYKKSKQINKFHQLIDFHYNPYLNSLYIFTSNDIRRYDGLSGRLKQVITNLSDEKFEFIITAGQFGPKCRKIYVGDAAGYIRQYMTQTGQFLTQLKPFQEVNKNYFKQIKKILYVKQEDIIICASADSRILIYIRNDLNQYHLIRDIRGSHSSQLTCISYSHWFSKLITGCESGTVNIWNSQKYFLEAVLVIGKQKILDVSFLKNYPIIIIATQKFIYCYALRQYQQQSKKYKCLFKISNLINSVITPISCFAIQVKLSTLYSQDINSNQKNEELLKIINKQNFHISLAIGSTTGFINIYFLDILFEQFQIQPISKIQTQQQVQQKKYDHINIQKIVQAFINRRNLLDDHQQLKEVQNQKIFYKSWDAFSNKRVQKIKFLKDPLLILSSGSDQKFKVWQIDGKICGSINFETLKNTSWKVPQINIKKKLKQIDFVLYSLKLIQNEQQLKEQRIQQIKSKMLISKYVVDQYEYSKFIIFLKNSYPNDYKQFKLQQQVSIRKNKTPSINFQQDYESVVRKLKDRLHFIQKELIKPKQLDDQKKTTNFQHFHKKKLNQNKSKELKIFESKLDAIQKGISQQKYMKKLQKKQRLNKRKNIHLSKIQKTPPKNLLFVTYSQLKRNFTSLNRLLKPINIR